MAKRSAKKPTRTFPYVLISFGILMLSLWAAHTFFYTRTLALSDALLSTYKHEESYTKVPTYIQFEGIPRLDVVEAIKTTNVWPVARTKANHVYASAFPGQNGNIIFYGHNTDAVFGNIRDFKGGEIIYIGTAQGKQYQYRVTEVSTVPITKTELLAPTTEEVLTIYTCTGFLDSLRFVIRAIPIE